MNLRRDHFSFLQENSPKSSLVSIYSIDTEITDLYRGNHFYSSCFSLTGRILRNWYIAKNQIIRIDAIVRRSQVHRRWRKHRRRGNNLWNRLNGWAFDNPHIRTQPPYIQKINYGKIKHGDQQDSEENQPSR